MKTKEMTVKEKIRQCETIIENDGCAHVDHIFCDEYDRKKVTDEKCCIQNDCCSSTSVERAKAILEELKKDSVGIKEKVFQALGQASMCWSKTPKGKFDSDQAKKIGNELIKDIMLDIEDDIEFDKTIECLQKVSKDRDDLFLENKALKAKLRQEEDEIELLGGVYECDKELFFVHRSFGEEEGDKDGFQITRFDGQQSIYCFIDTEETVRAILKNFEMKYRGTLLELTK